MSTSLFIRFNFFFQWERDQNPFYYTLDGQKFRKSSYSESDRELVKRYTSKMSITPLGFYFRYNAKSPLSFDPSC